MSSFTRLRTSLIDFSTSPSLSLVKKIILQLSDLCALGRAGFLEYFDVGVFGITFNRLIRFVACLRLFDLLGMFSPYSKISGQCIYEDQSFEPFSLEFYERLL